MKKNAINILKEINYQGIDNSMWGISSEVNTSWYFGSPEDIDLDFEFLYLYLDEYMETVLDCRVDHRPDIKIEVDGQIIGIWEL